MLPLAPWVEAGLTSATLSRWSGELASLLPELTPWERLGALLACTRHAALRMLMDRDLTPLRALNDARRYLVQCDALDVPLADTIAHLCLGLFPATPTTPAARHGGLLLTAPR